ACRCQALVVLARPEPLSRELAGAFPERPFGVEFWDGTSVPATTAEGPVFRVRSPSALAHVLRAPGQLGLGRAYVSGALEVDDLDAGLELLDTWSAPPLDRGTVARIALAAARSHGLRPPPRVPNAQLRPRGRPRSRERDAR